MQTSQKVLKLDKQSHMRASRPAIHANMQVPDLQERVGYCLVRFRDT